MKLVLLALLLAVATPPPLASAAPTPALTPTPKADSAVKKSPPKGKEPKDKKTKGMVPSMYVGLNFSFAQSQGVVGVPDGFSMALGLTLRGGLDYTKGPHRWRTGLLIQEATTKIPGIKPFLKSTDLIEVTSVYDYRFPRVRWLSVYGGIRLRGTLLEGNLVRPAETQLQLTSIEGTVFTDVLPAQKPYPLTKFLAPLLMEESAGAGFEALRHPAARLGFGVGLMAHQVFSQESYVVHDDEATPNVLELVQLRDYVQGGAEAHVTLTGRLADKLLGYRLGLRVMFPFATNVTTDHRYDQLINLELQAALSIRIFAWASLEYSLSVLRMELLRPGWQVANLLMLSISASVGDRAQGGTP